MKFVYNEQQGWNEVKDFPTSGTLELNYSTPKKPSNNILYSISPLALIDPTALIVGGIVLSIVLLEKYLERKGYYEKLEKLQVGMAFLLPICFLGGFVYFITQNDILGWL